MSNEAMKPFERMQRKTQPIRDRMLKSKKGAAQKGKLNKDRKFPKFHYNRWRRDNVRTHRGSPPTYEKWLEMEQ